MKKKTVLLIVFIALILVGSFINFYCTNFVLSDVSNLTYGIKNRPEGIFASLPGLNFAFLFVLACIFIIRYLRRPQYLKRLSRLYVIIGMSFSFIGLISAILAGAIVYKTFTASNPFPGYLILSIVLFSLFLIAGVLFFIFVFPKMEYSEEKRKLTAGYIFYSIVLAVTTYYAFNRLGALMWSPVYADAPTLYMTWPFYLGLILPILTFVHTFFYSYDFYKKRCGIALIIINVINGLFIASVIFVIVMGMQNTEFISVISPAMGASRLLAKPIDIIAHFVIFGLVNIYAIYHSIRYYKKHGVKKIKE